MSRINIKGIANTYKYLIPSYFIGPFCISLFFITFCLYLLQIYYEGFISPKYLLIFNLVSIYIGAVNWYLQKRENFRVREKIQNLVVDIFVVSLSLVTLIGLYLYSISEIFLIYLLLSLSIVSTFTILNDRSSTNTLLKENTTRTSLAIIFSLIFIGLILRLNDLSNLSFWFDESISVLIGKRISEGHGATFLSGIHYDRAIIYHYLLALFLKFHENIFLISRLVNILFYIPLTILIFIKSKKYFGSDAAIISTFLFTISSFNIAMFREARFYEFLNLLFLLVTFNILTLLEKYLDYSKNNSHSLLLTLCEFTKTNWTHILLTITLGAVLLTTSEISAYIIYPLILLSAYAFIAYRNKFWLIFGSISFLSLLTGLIIKYKESFQFSFLLRQPQLFWKLLVPDKPFLDFITYLSNYEYNFIYIIVILLIPFLIFRKKEFVLNYLSIFLISLFTIISIQGYGTLTIRYYYILMPFIAILSGAVITKYLGILKRANRFAYILTSLIFSLMMLNCIHFAVIESNSITAQDSLIDIKNNNFIDEFTFISKNIDLQDSIVISDMQSSISYYLFFNKKPDYLITENTKKELLLNDRDIYLDIPTISYLDFPLKKKIYVVLWYSPAYTPQSLLAYLETNGTLIYKQDAKRIYLLQ